VKLRSFQRSGPAGKINVTPLIDVVMVLIIFYLIVGKMASDRKAPVSLPSSAIGTSEEGGGKTIVLTIRDQSGKAQVLLDGAEITNIASLVPMLTGMDASKRVVQLRADKTLAYGAVAPVLEACRSAGIASVKLATQREHGKAGG
jgi:biopolymer transport protein ExbD